MTVKSSLACQMMAMHDPDRRGILVPANQLAQTPFKEGDRFSIRKGQREFFCVIIQKDPRGDIPYEKYGIFIRRTKRVDAYMGGLFERFRVTPVKDHPDRLKISPLENEMEHMCKPDRPE
jgi:hypothetical protein